MEKRLKKKEVKSLHPQRVIVFIQLLPLAPKSSPMNDVCSNQSHLSETIHILAISGI